MDDLFGNVPQPNVEVVRESSRPLTPDDIRGRMLQLISTLRDSDAIPFDPPEFQKHVAMFPIMAQWLPDGEGEQLVLQFEAEVERLKKAA